MAGIQVDQLIKAVGVGATKDTLGEYQAKIGEIATRMLEYTRQLRSDRKFAKSSDSRRIEIAEDGSEDFRVFHKEFPIVAQHMLHGKFDSRAFRVMLTKIYKRSTTATSKPQPRKSTKRGENEEHWICLQAEYMRSLWIADQRKLGRKITEVDKRAIFVKSYKELCESFDSFRREHKEIQQRIDVDALIAKREKFRETTVRATHGSIAVSDREHWVRHLQYMLLCQRRKDVIAQLKAAAVAGEWISARLRLQVIPAFHPDGCSGESTVESVNPSQYYY